MEYEQSTLFYDCVSGFCRIRSIRLCGLSVFFLVTIIPEEHWTHTLWTDIGGVASSPLICSRVYKARVCEFYEATLSVIILTVVLVLLVTGMAVAERLSCCAASTLLNLTAPRSCSCSQDVGDLRKKEKFRDWPRCILGCDRHRGPCAHNYKLKRSRMYVRVLSFSRSFFIYLRWPAVIPRPIPEALNCLPLKVASSIVFVDFILLVVMESGVFVHPIELSFVSLTIYLNGLRRSHSSIDNVQCQGTLCVSFCTTHCSSYRTLRNTVRGWSSSTFAVTLYRDGGSRSMFVHSSSSEGSLNEGILYYIYLLGVLRVHCWHIIYLLE